MVLPNFTPFRQVVWIHYQTYHSIIANLVLTNYLYKFFILLKITLKSLVEKNSFFYLSLDPINHTLMKLSNLWRWIQTYDVECWGLRRPLIEHPNFFVITAYKWFCLTLRLFVKLSEFTIRPITQTVSRSTDCLDLQRKKNIANLVLTNYLYRFLILSKSLWNF